MFWQTLKERLFGKWEPVGFTDIVLTIATQKKNDEYTMLITFWQNSKTQKRRYSIDAHWDVLRVWRKTKYFTSCELWINTGIQPDFYKDIVVEKLRR